MISVRNLHKTFGTHTVLRGIDLDINKGEVVVILGPSGSGKTTLLRCLNALEWPKQGTITFAGEPPLHMDFADPAAKKSVLALRRKSGMVFQQYNLFPHKTALENVTEGPVYVQRKPLSQARKEALQLLDKVGLADKADLYPYQLSGGQQQRVSIARAAVKRPALILADEPTANLDSKTGSGIIALLSELRTQYGTTIVLTSHDEHILQKADRCIALHDGTVAEA